MFAPPVFAGITLAFNASMRNHHLMTRKPSGSTFSDRHHTMPRRVRAVLGPTNTGKTHYALERMLAHASGIIGFPLRLLARENYERMVAIKGIRAVALITGEEKIVPPGAKWISCTTEAMPLNRQVEFVAIDEIQLCADPDRGHIFTDRLLNARGMVETLFLGAETIRPLLHRLVPEIEIDTRPRLSQLIGTGHTKLSRLPARSAIVAFSAADVYAIAEAIRQRRGGCAIVMGRMSPRTRNAQVQLYQNKEVDYLVATDAIGMGLNMDVNHVALAALTKFDGTTIRPLRPQEIAQIAGRAGRGTRDGTFGTTAEARPMNEATVEAIEAHRFDPLSRLYWRNGQLDFTNPRTLLASLHAPPPTAGLTAGRPATDLLTLEALAEEQDILGATTDRKATQLLWDVCQIPDFRKLGDDSHIRLCQRLFFHILREGTVPDAWLESHIAGFARTEGDIETLMHRLSGVRIAAYVAARTDWTAKAAHWQERARHVEDMLSDALHERLTARFVDRRATSLLRRLDSDGDRTLLSAVTNTGDVVVEGHAVGRVEGFALKPHFAATGPEQRLMLRVGRRALLQEIPRRIQSLSDAPDSEFALSLEDGSLTWQTVLIGRLIGSATVLEPDLRVLQGEFQDARQRDRVQDRLRSFMETEIRTVLAPLFAARDATAGHPHLRGIVHRLMENGGIVQRQADDHAISSGMHAHLRRLGIIVGHLVIYMPALLKPGAMALRHLLLSLHDGCQISVPPSHRVVMPIADLEKKEAPSLATKETVSQATLRRNLGWLTIDPYLLRIDVAERLLSAIGALTRDGDRPAPADLASRFGLSQDILICALDALHIRHRQAHPPHPSFYGPAAPLMLLHKARKQNRSKVVSRPRMTGRKQPSAGHAPIDGPFAALSALRRKL